MVFKVALSQAIAIICYFVLIPKCSKLIAVLHTTLYWAMYKKVESARLHENQINFSRVQLFSV